MKKVSVCPFCFSPDHSATFCWKNPNRKPIARRTPLKPSSKPIPKEGKVAKEWRLTRRKWATKDAGGRKAALEKIWQCHYCGVNLVLTKDHPYYQDGLAQILTLDHVKPRSSHPGLRAEFDNIVPCCGSDNRLKGSKSYEKFCAQYYPHLLTKGI